MLKRVRIRQYKGFEKFDLTLRAFNVVVGPNNAGKSTAISIVRLFSILLRNASRINPSIGIDDNGRRVVGYPLSLARLRELPGYSAENVHYEFRDEEARIEMSTKSDFTIVAVWPAGDEEPYYYIDYKPGMNVTRRSQVTDYGPSIGVVPGLNPIEHQEEVLTAKYLRDSAGSRLTSRHFRNYLYLLKQDDPQEFDETIRFMIEHTPELEEIDLRSVVTTKGLQLDLFFREKGSNSEREIFWAGDGLQIWLQVLYHSYSQRTVDSLVLDEPDVFLHPDLQRRLVSMLEELGPQITVATHAPEVIAEASRESIVWIDRVGKTAARRVQNSAALDQMVSDLGSAFDLGIARALRSRVVLFVEGQDMKLLRTLAGKVGAQNLSKERRPVGVVPLGGFDNWPLIEPFAWMKESLLQDAVRMFVLLDRDYRDDDEVKSVVSRLSAIDVTAHIWRRKEIESYLLVPSAMARASGLEESLIRSFLEEAVEEQAGEVQANLFSKLRRQHRGVDDKHIFSLLQGRRQQVWSSPESKLAIAPPKLVIPSLNRKIAEAGGQTFSPRKLALVMRKSEIAEEVSTFLMDVEAAIDERDAIARG